MTDDNQLSLGSDEQKVSYGIGRQFGEHLAATNIDAIDLEAVIAGMEQAFLGQPSVLDSEELADAYGIIEAQLKSLARQAARNLQAQGDEYLQRNAKRNGVITTESGLQYEIKVKGQGQKPSINDVVKIHYHGTLLNGEVFDSTIEANEPVELAVQSLIEGWKEAIQMMPIGSKWGLHIPAALAYDKSVKNMPANTVLAVDVELLDII
ncbi:MAG: FKBP-type peptidyl-prolyl cis-trans isomerase FklB [Chitinophagales bacterium]|jgi:FKBP-type peptidyl-prolyl cis-trans isomerase FklB|tara:strand:+ start:3515 stop:4138 length:624 start_codon:yes stop_codon:yes gene_type:complete